MQAIIQMPHKQMYNQHGDNGIQFYSLRRAEMLSMTEEYIPTPCDYTRRARPPPRKGQGALTWIVWNYVKIMVMATTPKRGVLSLAERDHGEGDAWRSSQEGGDNSRFWI
jgi:hypothetical protein